VQMYRVVGKVYASKYLGEFEANSPEEAVELALASDAEWCHLAAAGRHVWFLPGDEDYRYDDAVTVISGRISEPGSSVLSRLQDLLGKRDPNRNLVWR
jgi:hypothetical protein